MSAALKPLIGAAAFVMLKHEVGALTSYWHLVVGIILIAVVMSRANGIFGWIESRWGARIERRSAVVAHKDTQEVTGDA